MPTPDRFGAIPSIDRILSMPGIVNFLETSSREYVVNTIRAVCTDLRAAIRAGDDLLEIEEEILRRVRTRIQAHLSASLPSVTNATGIVIHTNLGRATLPEEAVAAITRVARGASALEFDLKSGQRGDRDRIVEEDLLALTGAEAATVVNNNAAALLLALNTLAEGKRVIVSRGELIEIGGSFRIPDVMIKSGVRLIEVGTTNRTHIRDVEDAIDAETGAILKVHTSNYQIVGFTAEVSLKELTEIGHRHRIPVIEDLGSGALVDLSVWGLPSEPVVRERIAAGADIVTFSGDKLLGGPQAGIIVGRRNAIELIKKNPLKRALRPDKLTLAALSAVLQLYRSAPNLAQSIPTLRALTRPLNEIRAVGEQAVTALTNLLGDELAFALVESTAKVGSGAQPTESLPSHAVEVTSSSESPDGIARRFRNADPPIIGRIHDGRFLLDLRLITDPTELVPRTQ